MSPRVGTTSVSSFRLAQKLGQCALVESWAGTQLQPDSVTGRAVTLHRLLASTAGDAGTSALAAVVERSFAHPDGRTLCLLDVGVARKGIWLVEEAADAQSVRALVHAMASQHARFQPGEGIALFRQLAHALASLHALEPPVVHGDVCSSTVVVTGDGLVRLSLSGVAAALGKGSSGPLRAEAQALAPEQLDGVASAATDCFRLGALLFEFVTGRSLFPTQDPVRAVAMARAYVGPPRALLDDVATPIASLLESLLQPSPGARTSAAAARRVLDELAQAQRWPTGPDVIATLRAHFLPPGPRGAAPPTGELLVLESLHPSGSSQGVALAEEAPSGVVQLQRAAPATPAASHDSGARPPAPRTAPGEPPGGVSIGRVATRKVARREARPAVIVQPAAPGEGALSPPSSRGSGGLKGYHIGPFLLGRKQISSEQLEAGIAYAREYSIPLADALVAIAAVDPEDMVAALGEFTRTPSIAAERLDKLEVAPEALALLAPDVASGLCALPLALKGRSQLVVAVRDPMDEALVGKLKGLCGVTSVVAMRASERALRRALRRVYGPSGWTPADTLEGDPGGAPAPSPGTPAAPLAAGSEAATGRFPATATGAFAASVASSAERADREPFARSLRAVPLGASDDADTTGEFWGAGPPDISEADSSAPFQDGGGQAVEPEASPEVPPEARPEAPPEHRAPARGATSAPGVVALSPLLSNDVSADDARALARGARPAARSTDSSRQKRTPHGERLLVDALLQAAGADGRAARSFLQWLEASARRLVLPQAETDRLWSATAALVVANVVAKRPPCTLTLAGVTEAAAQFGALWTTVGPLLNALLVERRGRVTAPGPALLDGAFTLVAAAGRVPPRPADAAPHLEELQARLPPSVVEALAAELHRLDEG